MTTCCDALEAQEPMPSPFTRILASGYYDGPTEGIVECGKCGRTFAFRMLAWDEEQNVRAFGLAPVAWNYEALCVKLLKTPPVAALTLVPPLPSSESSELDRLLTATVTHVVASENLLAELLASRAVQPGEVSLGRDWLQWLGVERRAPR